MLIHRLRIRGLLSFGPQGIDVGLRPLNVLIGPNGSGKSNLLKSVMLLKAAPRDLAGALAHGGNTARDWIWSGEPAVTKATIEAFLESPEGPRKLGRELRFTECRQGFEVAEADVTNERVLTRLREKLDRIRLYRAWELGRGTLWRTPQMTDQPNDILRDDGKNLALVLDRLCRSPKVKTRLLRALRRLYDGIRDFEVIIYGDTVQMFLREGGEIKVPATRLSDGTLRYLCLLAILCHPTPPPLVCIEQPELGLHPDVLPTLGELLLEASERGQLIVTTHSEVLVDALTNQPECVVVCEKRDGETRMCRLRADDLGESPERYGLGELWVSGEIGGNRW